MRKGLKELCRIGIRARGVGYMENRINGRFGLR